MYKFISWIRTRLWFTALVIVVSILSYPRVRNLVLNVEVTGAERGYRVAQRSGCFNCHGPDGSGGVKNPGSQDGEVPAFAGGTIMMWVKSEQELREYILDGAPARKRDSQRFREQRKAELLAMPAYRGALSATDLDDLIAYLRAVSGLITPPDALAAQGKDVAYRLGCFHCHGPMGAGKMGNPGSLKGYIPSWWGADFRDLVRSDDELHNWIVEGQIARLRDHPIAKYFMRWQRVSMPAYRDLISDAELQALMRYVRWVNSGEWQPKPLDLAH